MENILPTATLAPSTQLEDSNKNKSSQQSFNYLSHVVKPTDVKPSDNIFSVVFNVRDALDYGKASLINGYDCKGKNLILGDRYFMKSGKCNSDASVSECKGQDRYVYVDNVPMNFSPCVDLSQPISKRCQTNQNSGLIPGVIQDTMQINPFELISSIAGTGSVINDKCVLRTEKVGWQSGSEQNFIYETRCAAERKPLVCGLDFMTENFTQQNDSNEGTLFSLLPNISYSSLLFGAFLILLLFVCYQLFV
jgi:hypothetical protein